jgi:hypothetical protein
MGAPSGSVAPVERRRHARVTFTPFQRPHLTLATGRYDVLDASLGGLRILHTSPARPQVGTQITGSLEWIHGDAPISLTGTIVRVSAEDFVIQYEQGVIPLGYLPWAAPA